MKNLTVSNYMSRLPHTLSKNHTLNEAKNLMHEHSIRHLPILERGRVIGMLSERDIDFLSNYRGIDIHTEKVDQAMSDDPYIVTPETLLDEVCREMIKRKVGSVLIEEDQKLVGIFTWIDALKVLESTCHN